MFFSIFLHGKRLSLWNIYPHTLSFGFGVFFATNTLPELALRSPAIIDNIVVFPQPDGPTMAINS